MHPAPSIGTIHLLLGSTSFYTSSSIYICKIINIYIAHLLFRGTGIHLVKSMLAAH